MNPTAHIRWAAALTTIVVLVACAPPRLPPDDPSQPSHGDPEVSQVTVPSPPELSVAASPDEPNENPMAAGQTWKGSYLCGQGNTELRVEIVKVEGDQVEAIFHFHHRESGAQGAYRLSGPYQARGRRLKLTAGAWIEQPPGYVTVGMEGVVGKRRYSGDILDESCGGFSVVRQRSR